MKYYPLMNILNYSHFSIPAVPKIGRAVHYLTSKTIRAKKRQTPLHINHNIKSNDKAISINMPSRMSFTYT